MGKRTLRNILITLTILAAATVICFFLQQSVGTEAHAPLLFVLAVLLPTRRFCLCWRFCSYPVLQTGTGTGSFPPWRR